MQKKFIFISIILVLLVVIVGIFAFTKSRSANPAPESSASTQEEADYFPNDKDDDGILDVEEKKMGTKENEIDSDADGLFDSTEIEDTKTNPTNPDTDGDGYKDGFEILNGYNPVGDGKIPS